MTIDSLFHGLKSLQELGENHFSYTGVNYNGLKKFININDGSFILAERCDSDHHLHKKYSVILHGRKDISLHRIR